MHRSNPIGVAAPNVEMRKLPIVADQRGIAILEPPIEVNDRDARSTRHRYDAITRLQDESAVSHSTILRECAVDYESRNNVVS